MRLKYPVVLASSSPRRQELLRPIVPEFEIDTPDIDETPDPNEEPAQTARRLARDKCLAVFERHPDHLVIAGDTVVAYQESTVWTQLGKPEDPADAVRILSLLSGRTHTVFTGIALRWPTGLYVGVEQTEVTFRELSQDEIEAYVATGEPMDKAGGYGCQAGGGTFITQYRGSKTSVMGLPTEHLAEALRDVR